MLVGSVSIGGVIGFLIGIAMASSSSRQVAVNVSAFMAQVSSVVGQWLYFSLMESSRLQATVGKLAVGIVVTDENGMRIGFGRATGRYFAKFISAIILGIGYLMAGWTQRKQALHDMIAGTLVVRKGLR